MLVLLGGVMQVSAWTDLTLICEANNWGSGDLSKYKFTSLSTDHYSFTLDASKIKTGKFYFRIHNDNGQLVPSNDNDGDVTGKNFKTNTYNNGSNKAFYIEQFPYAEEVTIYAWYENSNWYVKAVVVDGTYTICYDNTGTNWAKVYCYAYNNDHHFTSHWDWPGDEITPTDSKYIYTFKANSATKIIFNNNSGTETGSYDLINNGIYNNSGVTGIKVTIGSLGYATFSSVKSVDFSGETNVDAYIASAITDNKVVLTKHNKVPDHNGVLLKGTAGTYNIPVTESPDAITTNYLMATVGATKVAASDPTNNKYRYFLSGTTVENVGFYNLSSEQTSAAGKAYLETSDALNSDSYARAAWTFEDTTTGIANLNVNDNTNIDANAPMYNLAGQRVGKNYKGVVIMNGKKVVLK